MKKFVFSSILFFLSLYCFTQTVPTIILDSNTKSFDAPIPPYKAFNVKMNYPGDFTDILLIPTCKSGKLYDFSCTKSKEVYIIKDTDYWITVEEKKKFLYIRFDNINNKKREENDLKQIRPMKSYALIVLFGRISLDKVIIDYLKSAVVNNKPDKDKFLGDYKKFRRKQDKNSKTFIVPSDMVLTELDFQLKDEKKRIILKKLFDEIEKNKTELIKSINYNSDFKTEEFEKLLRFLLVMDHEKLKNLGFEIEPLNKTISSLILFEASDFEKLLIGESSLSENANGEKLILKSNIQSLGKLITFVNAYNSLSDDSVGEDFIIALKNLKKTLESNSKNLNEISKKLDELVANSEYAKDGTVIYSKLPNNTSANFNTYLFSFSERTKIKFTPDLGLVNYGFQSGFNEISPYFGFHYNFTYIDKNIPFRLIDKNVLDYLSISLGWSFNSIEKEGRREGLIGDGSLMTGLGVRINNTFRLTMGGNWFYKLDENPILNDRRLAVTPYLGLSIDFEVKELLNGFSKIFTP